MHNICENDRVRKQMKMKKIEVMLQRNIKATPLLSCVKGITQMMYI